ncbi:dynein beta chain, ciliary-like [Myripristis murdjan]|uniref:dynein beta chain, ciliary-like n=1 Tax=Myripristis murdjan TaxID=586833 RepID=UPI0011763D4F|nr:dynein beta chain, ciliary-like [Myripristis murdjan]
MKPEGGPVLFSLSLLLGSEAAVFEPLSSGLTERLDVLLSSAFSAAALIHTLSPRRARSYQLELQQGAELCALVEQVRRGLQAVQEEAERFREHLDRYAYLWQDDQQEVMQQFLSDGGVMTSQDSVAEGGRGPPTLQDFRKEMDSYQRVFGEVQQLDESVRLHGCLQVDLRPFKSSLLSVIQSWTSMFQQHLVDCVTCSLQQALQDSQPPPACTLPLSETILMLEASGVQLPDHLYTQLQVFASTDMKALRLHSEMS